VQTLRGARIKTARHADPARRKPKINFIVLGCERPARRGAAHSCSSFADLVKKKFQRFESKISFKSLDTFYDQIGRTRAAMGRAAMIAQGE
jgi:hypothetical protein